MIEYNKRLVEVDEILNYLSKEDYNKIPKEIITIIKDNKDKDYIWKYDNNKKLKEQDVSSDTIAILSYINMEYLLNHEQKEFVNRLHEQNEIANSKKYDTDIFQKKKVINTKKLPVEIKKETFFKKLVNFIKNLISKKTN